MKLSLFIADARVRAGLLCVVCGLAAALLLPTLLRAAAPAAVRDPAAALPLPEGGVQSDGFSLRLLQAELAEASGNVLTAPLATAALLHHLADLAAPGAGKDLALPEHLPNTNPLPKVFCGLFAEASLPFSMPPTQAGIMAVDFSGTASEAMHIMAQSVQESTGISPELSIGPDSVLGASPQLVAFLATAIPGPATAFPVELVKEQPFDNANGLQPKVLTLRGSIPARLAHAEDESWLALALPLLPQEGAEGEPLFFCAILPRTPAREFAQQLTPQQLSDIRAALARTPQALTSISLPAVHTNPSPRAVTPLPPLPGLSALTAPGALRRLSPANIPLSSLLVCNSFSLAAPAPRQATALPPAQDAPAASFSRPFIWFVGDLTSPAPPFLFGIIEEL